MHTKLLLLCLIIGSSVFAQRDSLTRLLIGGRIDYAVHQVEFSPLRSQTPLAGLSAYLSLRYADLAHVSFVAELGLVQAGWEEGTGGTDRYQRRTTYADFLISTQVNIGRGRIRPILQAGPFVSAPISDSEEIGAEFFTIEGSYYQAELPFRLNYGLQGGLGILLQLEQIDIQLHAYALAGLSDIIRSGDLGISTARRQAAGGSVSLRYRLF